MLKLFSFSYFYSCVVQNNYNFRHASFPCLHENSCFFVVFYLIENSYKLPSFAITTSMGDILISISETNFLESFEEPVEIPLSSKAAMLELNVLFLRRSFHFECTFLHSAFVNVIEKKVWFASKCFVCGKISMLLLLTFTVCKS